MRCVSQINNLMAQSRELCGYASKSLILKMIFALRREDVTLN